MQIIIRLSVAIIIGVLLGGAVNMALITLSPMIIAPPSGVEVSDPESLKAGIHLFEARHFVMPFLAHALGTFVGALLAGFIATHYSFWASTAVGAVFLAGGIAASVMIPAPLWFIAIDVLLAYLPTAWLAYWLVRKCRS